MLALSLGRSGFQIFVFFVACSTLVGKIRFEGSLGNHAEIYLFIFSAEIVEIIVIVKSIFGLFIVVERPLFDFSLGAPLGTRALDRDLRRGRRRRMRLKECLDLFWSREVTVDQFEKHFVNDFAVGCQIRSDAHLLHLGMRNALARLWPRFQEELIAIFYSMILTCESQPENRL